MSSSFGYCGETVRRFYQAFLNTMRGLKAAAKSEASLRQELAALALGIPVGLYVAPGVGWYVAMIGALFVALAVELLNTAIEKLADRVTRKRDRAIGLIKDFGSAAVFCSLCNAGLIWLGAIVVRFGLL